VSRQRLVEPRDGAGGAGQRAEQPGIDGNRKPRSVGWDAQQVEHGSFRNLRQINSLQLN
jgi:hypothetical protein